MDDDAIPLEKDGGAGSPSRTPTRDTHVTLMGGHRIRGPRRLADRTLHVAAIGGLDGDLTQATGIPDGAVIVKVALIGGVHLTVPADVEVEVRSVTLLGGVNQPPQAAAPGAKRVLLRAYGLIGGVRITRV